jgi:hypothetical protein
MQNILRNLVLAPVVLAASALTANTAMAQATVNVPFTFQVAGKVLPAGQYYVGRDGNSSIVTLKSAETAQAFNWILTPGSPAPTDTAVVLRFDGEGEQHTLRTVQYGALITPRLDKKTWKTEHLPTQVVLGR